MEREREREREREVEFVHTLSAGKESRHAISPIHRTTDLCDILNSEIGLTLNKTVVDLVQRQNISITLSPS